MEICGKVESIRYLTSTYACLRVKSVFPEPLGGWGPLCGNSAPVAFLMLSPPRPLPSSGSLFHSLLPTAQSQYLWNKIYKCPVLL